MEKEVSNYIEEYDIEEDEIKCYVNKVITIYD